ncbi:MAG: cation:proton antiporter [Cryobacterium sp.]|nr:cation:proton antiporter [Cryobacterium sp.]
METVIVAVGALLVVAGSAALAPKLRIPAPLILVIVGIVVSILPFMPVVSIDPEWILIGILPPLLYSASVSMPVMNFRREFTAISALSITLVVVSAVVLGVFFAWLVPDLGIWWGIALGAIVSPTDAVAVSIVKRVGVSSRVVSVLNGESLLNDATALVLLRTAIVATAASISLWNVVGTFAYSVAVAAALGGAVGFANLWVRSRVTDSTVNTVISFTVPFLASVPAELLGASGLVAAVVAGLITGHGAARRLSPQHRLSDSQNWHTVELVLEGAIFLIMGLELAGIVADVERESVGIGIALAIAAGALVLTLFVRVAFIAPMLVALRNRARRGVRSKPRLKVMEEWLESPQPRAGRDGTVRPVPASGRIERAKKFTRRALFDLDYFTAAPLGWREGGILVWAGMRGAITLAAAQTLPGDAPHRSLLVHIAFTVAAGSLVLQGGSLAALVRWLKPARTDEAVLTEERANLLAMMRSAAARANEHDPTPLESRHSSKEAALRGIEAQRKALLDARDVGAFSAESIAQALVNLDADQISIELKGGPET